MANEKKTAAKKSTTRACSSKKSNGVKACGSSKVDCKSRTQSTKSDATK